MNKQQLIKQLSEFDLEEIEAKIYLYLLENGPKTPLELSRELNLNRSRIYRYIDKLTAKGIAHETIAKWGKKIEAEDPKNLELILKKLENELNQKKQILPQILDDLNTLPQNALINFEIKHYRGTEGFKQMFWNCLSAKKELLVFGFLTRNEFVGKEFAEKIRFEQVKRKITYYEVENATDQGDYWYTDVPNWEKYYKSRHIPPKVLKIKQQILINKNTVAVMNLYKNERVGIEIVNTNFADMYKQIFWNYWETAGKIGNETNKKPKTV